jgi:hypothetical protein
MLAHDTINSGVRAGMIARHIAVCVPARDEAVLLPGLIAGIRAQRAVGTVRVTLCLFLDGCTDGSAQVAQVHAGGIPMLIEEGPGGQGSNAGRARRAAMALGVGCGADILLTTDADSVPAPDWIDRALIALAAAEVVAGRIVREHAEADPMQGRIERYYDRLYAYRRALDPLPWEGAVTHHQTGGANLGFRSAAYLALGGFRELAAGEDAALVDAAGRAGLRVRRDPRVIVRTSARRQGRAIGGLATALAALDRGVEPELGLPHAAAWQYVRHAEARACFAALPDPMVAGQLGMLLGLTADHVIGVARDCPNGEAFAMRVVPAAPDAGRTVRLGEAERMLAGLERALLGQAA